MNSKKILQSSSHTQKKMKTQKIQRYFWPHENLFQLKIRSLTDENLVVIAPARRAGDPGSIPGPGENFFS